jgi:uncharacterized membrane protein YkvA (DUF1232 family)
VWWRAALLSGAVMIVSWAALLLLVAYARPDRASLAQMARVLPDTIRLVRRLAADRTIPRSARLPAWMLLAYLALPVDLVPDFVPVIGYADDAILSGFVLRRLMRRAGETKVVAHWPGSPEGLDTLRRVLFLDAWSVR